MSYAELHCLSNFSFLRGASHAQELVAQAQANGYAALAITDECSMAGIVRAHGQAKKHGLRLVVGTELQLADGPKLVLLAEDHAGYAAICGAITLARRAADKGHYRITRADLDTPLPGVSVLWIPRGIDELAELDWLRARYAGCAWIAVELHRGPDDGARLAHLQALGRRFGLPLVAAGDVHMHAPQRRPLQDTLTAIRLGRPVSECGFELFPNAERHLRTLPDLAALYPPELLRETLAVADRCRFSMADLKYDYPHEIVAPGFADATAYLRDLTAQGMQWRWPAGTPPKVRTEIDKELKLIAELKYEHFFLTVHDIVREARARGILCQGRGSAANSSVCYALGITEVDPARGTLLFERFVSKERNEPPDIDVDFEHQRREEVIQYVFAKYGRERAALAATVISYRPRSALRDVGKALGFTLDQVDGLSKSLAWWDQAKELPARLREQGFDPDNLQVCLLLRLVNDILGFPRHLSQHVGGFVIADQPLRQLVPIENAAMPERTIIQWDKDDLEALGLLKVDCLALGMLSALRRSFELNRGFTGEALDLDSVPKEDPETYQMICNGKTMGVFQIESRAQMSMLPRLQPRNFYDLVIQIAIVRPGPIQGGMVHPYLKRRMGREPVDCPPGLQAVLGRTLGIPLFQEQVMQIAMVAANFSAGEADMVRRSMAAWKRDGGLTQFHDKLIAGMLKNGYAPEFAESIYQMVLGFGSYGFPESHSASFAVLAYASSWLKCHRPAAFVAGLINSQPMGFYPPSMLVQEARRAGVEVRAADVTLSDWDCTLEPDAHGRAAIRLGLRIVKGLPEAAAQAIVAARCVRAFTNVDDLVHRARLDARARKALAQADALATLAGHRHRARWQALGVQDLPGFLDGHAGAEAVLELPAPAEGAEILNDYRSTGLTLRRHPLALLRPRLRRERVLRAADLEATPADRRVTVAGIVMFRQRPQTASGVVFVSLEDETGIVNLVVWPKVVEAQRRALLGSNLLVVSGPLQKVDGVTHVIAEQLEDRSAWLGSLPLLSRDFH
ncbi:MAG TPA: error-prone DNA polymerase [Solimonas sp.]|nr:error-prone DNA polymerase [Solimonas sp.]